MSKHQVLYWFIRTSFFIDPIQKFDKPLTIDPTENFLILWITLRKFLVAAAEC
jgi:hypothetical protein